MQLILGTANCCVETSGRTVPGCTSRACDTCAHETADVFLKRGS